jgi:DinB superfamily
MLDRRIEIKKTLRATPVVLRALVSGVDDRRLRHRPAPGEWAIIEVVAHLADTEERALGRVRRMLAEDHPQLEPFDQEALAVQRHYLDLDLEGELARVEQLRGQHLAVLEVLDAPGWERTGQHGEHGVLSVELTRPTWRPKRSTTWLRSPGCSSQLGHARHDPTHRPALPLAANGWIKLS